MTELLKVSIEEKDVKEAAGKGTDAFVNLFVRRISASAGGELNAESMQRLIGDQITLWAFSILHEEIMDGGFVQLIHNGYGPFFFRNPFAKAMRLWGLDECAKLINKARKLYDKYGEELTRECSDEEFMALFERFPAFDELDDRFVEEEENMVARVAYYIDEHIGNFATIV